jgi:hypothetical protein
VVEKTTNERSKCPSSHPHEVIHFIWPGFHEYCDCFDAGYTYNNALFIEESCPTESCGEDCTQTVPGCYIKHAIHPVVMADLGNYRICGARDSKNFLEAVRGQREGEICS